jgi:hypothetical protein
LANKEMVHIVLWDFIADKESPLATVHSLLRETLSSNYNFFFDGTTTHRHIIIGEDGLTVTKDAYEGYSSAAFTTLPLTRSAELTFQCLRLVDWIAVGAADRDKLRNTRIPNGLDGSHAWLVSTEGYIWYPGSNHHNSRNPFRLDRTGKLLMVMRYDSFNNTLTFRSGSETFVMEDIPTGLYPFIILFQRDDSARIVGPTDGYARYYKQPRVRSEEPYEK